MVAFSRKQILGRDEVALYHCWARCVRRARLCGRDPESGKDYSYRRRWIHDRVRDLASCFAIEVSGITVMHNHYHLVLRTRPDLVATWSDEQVVRRWLRLSSKKLELRRPKEQQIQAALADRKLVAKYRDHLSNLSRFMWYLNEPIARAANREDGVKGRFFEERFGCQRILDLTGLLACQVYVDLNPIRAGLAKTPETSEFTSAADRIWDRQQSRAGGRSHPRSGWLTPIPISGDRYPGAARGRRASDKGLFDFDLDHYLALLDWTGRQVRSDKRGAIPADLAPILERLAIRTETWVDLVSEFGHRFRRLVGRPSEITTAASHCHQRWMHGMKSARRAFK